MNIKMYCLCLLNLFLHLKLKILEQNTKFNDLTMNSNEQVIDKTINTARFVDED